MDAMFVNSFTHFFVANDSSSFEEDWCGMPKGGLLHFGTVTSAELSQECVASC